MGFIFLSQKKGAQLVTIANVLKIRIDTGKLELSRGKINCAYVHYWKSCKVIHISWSSELQLTLCFI